MVVDAVVVLSTLVSIRLRREVFLTVFWLVDDVEIVAVAFERVSIGIVIMSDCALPFIYLSS